MDNQALQQIKDIIDRNNQVAIAVGPGAKLDELAAALSLYLTFQNAGKNVAVASSSEPLVEHSSLVGIDKVATKLEGSSKGDFVVSFPYKEEGEIEKVSYTLDNGLLNIIVKPGEQGLSFSERDVKYTHGGGLSGLLITVGVPSLAQLAGVYTPQDGQNVTIINIDNKDTNENYGHVVLVSPRFSSVSEQVADLLLSLGYDFDVDTAQNLLSGITDATGNFQAAQTSYLAFEIAAILLRKGAKRKQSQTPPPPSSVSSQPVRQSAQPHEEIRQRQQQQFDQRRAQQTSRQQVQQQPQPARQPQQRIGQNQVPVQQKEDLNPPPDWLTPKVYKGSTNI